MKCNFSHKIEAKVILSIIWNKPANSPDEYFTRCYLERELQAIAIKTGIEMENLFNSKSDEQTIKYNRMFQDANFDIISWLHGMKEPPQP